MLHDLLVVDTDTVFKLLLAMWAVFCGLLAHMWGDYVLQNHWMALRKGDATSEGFLAVTLHGLTYGILFGVILVLISNSAGIALAAWLIIVLSHMAIDHFKPPRLWAEWYGNGTHGTVMPALMPKATIADDAPPFLKVWLIIIIDNIWHVTINTVMLALAALL